MKSNLPNPCALEFGRDFCGLFFERHPVPLWVYDVRTLRFVAVNDAAVAQYGYTREEFLAMTLEDIRPADDVPALRERLAQSLARPPGAPDPAGEWRHRRKDGTLLTVEITAFNFEQAGRPFRLVYARDVTERNVMRGRFLHMQRLENLGLLAAGIAHDLNNILSPMLMAAPLLRAHAARPEDLRILDALERSAQRGGNLVRQILSFARGAGTEKALLQPRHVLREVAELVTDTFPKSIALEFDIPSDLWLVRANPTQLHQVLLNLCVNSRDAMPNGGRLQIRARNLPASADHPQPGLLLEVVDNGCGMTPEIQKRSWEPFFTTKTDGRGTGLGLATVKDIVADHHGTITLESEVGRGTTFTIRLPVASEHTAPAEPPASSPPMPAGARSELVLVIDDDDCLRQVIVDSLAAAGHRVLTDRNGAELMGRQFDRLVEVRLVLMDLDLPGQDGLSLARVLQRAQPGLRILFLTGSAGAPGFVPCVLPAHAPMLRKPFTVDALLRAVQAALAAPPCTL